METETLEQEDKLLENKLELGKKLGSWPRIYEMPEERNLVKGKRLGNRIK